MDRAASAGYRIVVIDEMRRAIAPLDIKAYFRLLSLLRQFGPMSSTLIPVKPASSADGPPTSQITPRRPHHSWLGLHRIHAPHR